MMTSNPVINGRSVRLLAQLSPDVITSTYKPCARANTRPLSGRRSLRTCADGGGGRARHGRHSADGVECSAGSAPAGESGTPGESTARAAGAERSSAACRAEACGREEKVGGAYLQVLNYTDSRWLAVCCQTRSRERATCLPF